jgi:mercuric ion transport protein
MRSVLGSKAALAAGVLAGIGGSACCVGPLLLVSVGISGAWISHLTALEPYRPIFAGAAVLLFAVAFWKLYMVPQTCAVEGDCVSEHTRKLQRTAFWVLMPITLGFLVSPWILAMVVYR